MPLTLLFVVFMLCILGPQWWVKYVLSKHATPRDKMPGTGGELAQHLLHRFELTQVKVEVAPDGGDHYDPGENTVRLSERYLNGKSLTAVAVAAHEVGHAIQFNRNEKVSLLRQRYLSKAHAAQKAGIYLLMSIPVLAPVFKIPQVPLIMLLIGVATLFSSVIIYAAILPEEWDASFNKALPILREGQYIPEEYLPAIKQILTACALTYVAAALADILRLWRWLAIIRALR